MCSIKFEIFLAILQWPCMVFNEWRGLALQCVRPEPWATDAKGFENRLKTNESTFDPFDGNIFKVDNPFANKSHKIQYI